jgi:putative phosphoribosyl transferase
MLNQIRQRLRTRQNAGRLLAEKLSTSSFLDSDCVVMAIPRGGVPVGREVASVLGIPFEIVLSKRIRHPAHREQSIGAVSLDEVMLQESTQFIPQSYVLSEVASLRRTLRDQFQLYYGNRDRKSVKGKTVILVDDVLRDIDELTASLNAVGRNDPYQIVVGAPVASLRVINYLEEQNIALEYLYPEVSQQSKPYTYFPEITKEEEINAFDSAMITA